MNFSDNLIAIRKRKGFNQKQMAEFLNIKHSTYANYETGFSKPELDTFLSISRTLIVTMDDLVYKKFSAEKEYVYNEQVRTINDPPISYTPEEPDRQELLLKIIQLTEKLLSLTEELRLKDNTIAKLTKNP